MRHLHREEAQIQQLLRTTRTIAVIGPSPRPEMRSHEVVRYLRLVGYDVIPIRPDRVQVDGLPTYARLDDVAGPVDLVVVYRRPSASVTHTVETVRKRADAVWFPPGTWDRGAEVLARLQNLAMIKDRCIMEDHRHLFGANGEAKAGHPRKTGVHVRRRRRVVEDNRVHPEVDGYTAGGGGGRNAGGGVRSILDERKMTVGRPSPRSGRYKLKLP